MNIKTTKIADFLARNQIDRDTWKRAGISWEILQDIGTDHESQVDRLRDSAEFLAKIVQRFEAVHSVRWRIKSTEHLLEKIIRKRASATPSAKYQKISVDNYFEVVTDLVGVRALHLFKEDCFLVDRALKQTWTPSETPKAYVRAGDLGDLNTRFTESGFEVEVHPAGYRSVHYVLGTRPMSRMVYVEVQVRTIFEEGWSEIDHRIRYPNFFSDPQVDYFLTIFNRLSGSADEMGSFVRELTAALQDFRTKLIDADREKKQAVATMEDTLADLDQFKQKDASMNQKLAALQAEVEKLKKAPSLDSLFRIDTNRTPVTLGFAKPDNLFPGLALSTPLDEEFLKTFVNLRGPTFELAKLKKE
jgi:putative GTP pyrophosphokinase